MLTAFTAIDYAVDSVNYRADHGKLTESERYLEVRKILRELEEYIRILDNENEVRFDAFLRKYEQEADNEH